jgi:hypothetical protein
MPKAFSNANPGANAMDIQIYVYDARGIVIAVRTFRTLKAAWRYIAKRNAKRGFNAVIHSIAS